MASYRGRVTAASRIIGRIPIGGAENNNGLPPFNVLGLQLLQRGGSSPLLNPSFAHWMQTSTPWDLLAKTRFSIMRSIQSISSWSTVTPSLGLFCVIGLHSIQPKHINSRSIVSYSVESNSTGVAKNDKRTPTSAGHERPVEDVLHHRAGRLERAPREDLRGILPGRGRQPPRRGAGHPAGCGEEDLGVAFREPRACRGAIRSGAEGSGRVTKDSADAIMQFAAGKLPAAGHIEPARLLARALEDGHGQST